MSLRRKIHTRFFACIFLIVTFQETCQAAEWFTTPSIQLREDYNDNVLLTTQPHSGESSTWVTPALNFGVASDIWQATGQASLTNSRYPGHSQLNSNAQNYSLGSSYKTERETWQLNGSYSKIPFITQETIGINTGLYTQNIITDTTSISPSWTWLITELTQLQLSYSQGNVSYLNGASSGLFDYRSSEASAKLSSQYDVYTQIFLQTTYSIFRVPSTSFKSKTKSYQVGATRSFSDTMNATFSLGSRSTLNQQQGIPICLLSFAASCLVPGPQIMASSRSSSPTFTASLEKQFETLHLSAAASRAYEPSAAGQELRSDSVFLSVTRPFTERLTGGLTINGYKMRVDAGSTASVDNRKVYQIQPSLSWQWTPEWNLGTGYSYTHVQRVNDTTSASSSETYLTLTYQWPTISISR
ncbi:MAG: hypothetical protein ACYC9H_12885 [Sulfuricaulis sp.]